MSDRSGVEYGGMEKLTEQVDEAMRRLNFLHNLLQDNKRLGYLDDINPLFYHAVSVEEDGQYVQKFVAESFVEALVALQDSMDAMNEQIDADADAAAGAVSEQDRDAEAHEMHGLAVCPRLATRRAACTPAR